MLASAFSRARAAPARAQLASTRPGAPLRVVVHRRTNRSLALAASANDDNITAPAAPSKFDDDEEKVFMETNGAPASLAFQCLMGATIIYLPLTIAAIGRAAWVTIRFTSRRIEVVNTSPLFASTQQIAYGQIEEVRSAPRAFNLWGDLVLFLKGGARIELTGLPEHKALAQYIRERSAEAKRAALEKTMQEAASRSARLAATQAAVAQQE